MTDRALTVVIPPELEAGFGLAGVETVTAVDSGEALEALDRLVEEGTGGVIAVYEPYLVETAPERRAVYESSLAPIVMPLPPGLEARDQEAHRARISAMLGRAVGYHITFGEETEP